ncbi:MAG: hypothetical protein GY913_27925 [Proteobacteria bacterium]|nr:hypothetical protein [Pseudomonadota bacterium]MCP4920739.1 hypothetical protein [Pseudomonadota bacterium]
MLLLLSALMGSDANAACEKQVAAAKKAKGAAVAPAFQKVVSCDAKAAKQNFPAIMQGAGDAESLIALSMVAIDAEVWNPVWEMLGKIPDYDARDVVAAGVGDQCGENETVVKFLQAAYFGLRDIDFAQWDDAMVSCKTESFDGWLMETVQNPPAKQYDEKWAKVAEVYVERKGADSLDSLAIGAQKAAGNGGPFEAILALMDAAVAPDLGEDISADDQARLEDALVNMAKGLPPEQARSIADRLANAGSEGAAASLLPAIYPDRVKSNGSFVYGAVAVEAADCDGTLNAVLHTAEVTEPGNRYILQDDIESPMRAFKPKLSKCMSEGDWTVIASAEPLGSDGMDDFVSGLEAQFVEKGYEVKIKGEKGVTLD